MDTIKIKKTFVNKINMGVLEDLDMSLEEFQNFKQTFNIKNLKVGKLRTLLNAFIVEGKLTRESDPEELVEVVEGLKSFLEKGRKMKAVKSKLRQKRS
jgi:hypothetical protein